jgi:hypothetical protein
MIAPKSQSQSDRLKYPYIHHTTDRPSTNQQQQTAIASNIMYLAIYEDKLEIDLILLGSLMCAIVSGNYATNIPYLALLSNQLFPFLDQLQ